MKLKYLIKQALSLVLAIMMITTSVPVLATTGTEATISINDVKAVPGQTVSVNISVKNNPGIATAIFTVTYNNDAMTLTAVELDQEFGGTYTPGPSLNSPVSVTWDSSTDNMNNGNMFKLTFDISDEADADEVYDIKISYGVGNICNLDEDDVDFQIDNGTITIVNPLPGDINCDQAVNAKDLTRMRKYFANWEVEVDPVALDCNGDGSINSKDLTRLRKYFADWDVELYYGTITTTKCKHTSLTAVAAKEATCTVDGNIAYWDCDGCNKLFSDAAGTTEISLESTVIEAGHTPAPAVRENEVAGNCKVEGTYDEVVYCSVCGTYEISRTQKIGEIGDHTPATPVKENEVAGNCQTPTTYDEVVYCSICGTHEMSRTQKTGDYGDHTYSTSWSMDETYHWHASTCGHTTEIKDKVEHNPANNICAVCEYDGRVKLTTPTITKVTADKIYWLGDDRATNFIVTVNGRYSQTYGADVGYAKFDELYYNENGITEIIDFSKTDNHIKVKAICTDGTYKDSEYGVYSGDAIYVPSAQVNPNILSKWGIGKGYNLLGVEEFEIEKDENNNDRIVITEETLSGKYFDTTETKASVFNPQKLLTAYSFDENGENKNATSSEMIYASSFDEYAFKASLNAERSAGINLFSIVNFGGESEIGISASFGKKDYSVYQAFTTTKTRRVYRLQTNGGLMTFNLQHLKYTLSESFLAAIEGDVSGYDFQSNTELAKYIYDTFGTHVILGVETGGRYLAVLDTSTSNIDVAADLRAKLGLEGGGTICDVVGLQLGTGMEINAAGSYKNETTTSKFKTIFFGGDIGSITDPKALQDAINSWEASVNAGSEVALGISSGTAECPVVSIEDLIRVSGYGDLADAFKELLIDVSDNAYKKLAEQYNNSNIRLLKSPYVDSEGKNVLEIDLSGYQKSGTLENTYDPNLINGELNIFPVMFNKYIDKIVIIGALDKANAKLIDNFSVVLSEEWSRPLEIEIKNLGVMAASDYGIVNMQNLPASVKPVIKYTGINIIGNTNGTYNYFAQNSNGDYKFAFNLNDGETLDISTAKTENDILYLPVIKKDLHTFAGWIDGSDNNVAKQNGEYIAEYDIVADITTIYPVLNLSTFKITVNNNEATDDNNCLTEFYWQYDVGPFRDSSCTQSLTDVQIPTPFRTGYIFDGYWLKTDNVYTSQAVTNDGIILPEYAFDGNTIIYAKWEPKIITISLKDEQFNVANYTLYEKYGVGFYSDAACTKSVSDIGDFTKTGYGFKGYKQNTTPVINADGTIAVKNTYFTENTTLNAEWEAGKYTITLNSALEVQGVSGQYTPGTTQVNVTYGSGATPVNITTPTRDGYTFEGYYASVSNNGTINAKGETQYINRDGKCQESIKTLQGGTLYAWWKPIQYKVTWNTIENIKIVVKRTSSPNAKASTGTLSSGATVYYGDELSVTYTASAGYSVSKNSDTITVTGNVDSNTIKATATANTYTVVYNGNGETSGSTASSSHTYNTSKALTLNGFKKTDYTFLGWSTDSNATTPTYDDGDPVMNLTSTQNATVTLYAVWLKTSHTITDHKVINCTEIKPNQYTIILGNYFDMNLIRNFCTKITVTSTFKTGNGGGADNNVVRIIELTTNDSVSLKRWAWKCGNLAFPEVTKESNSATISKTLSSITYNVSCEDENSWPLNISEVQAGMDHIETTITFSK